MSLSDDTCDSGEGHLERVRYFSRQLLGANDLTDDQAYHRAKQRLHNRLLHGWGIVCGLEVKGNPTAQAPLNVTICPGLALSPQGDEICVPDDVQFDLAKCTTGPADNRCSSPCSPIVPGRVDVGKPFWIAIKYAQCPSRPLRVSPIGCGCDDTACEYSRIRDGFEVSCLDALPASYTAVDDPPSVCKVLTQSKLIPCPPCPDSPWVVVARLQLAAGGSRISDILIDDRRMIVSAAVVQEYIRSQCA
jgi:hypothetical protein